MEMILLALHNEAQTHKLNTVEINCPQGKKTSSLHSHVLHIFARTVTQLEIS